MRGSAKGCELQHRGCNSQSDPSMGRMGCWSPSSSSDPCMGLVGTEWRDRQLETESEESVHSFADCKKCTEGTRSPVETGPTLDDHCLLLVVVCALRGDGTSVSN